MESCGECIQMKNSPWALYLWIVLAGLIFGWGARSAPAPQNVKVGKGFTFPYREGSQTKAVFTGLDAKPLPGGQILVSQFAMKTFRDGDAKQIDLIVEAPECIFDRATFVAASSGRIKVYTANTNLFIEGKGFLYQQTNGILIISKDVNTIIAKGVSHGTSSTSGLPIAGSLDRSSNSVIRVSSDHFRCLHQSNLVTYTANVR